MDNNQYLINRRKRKIQYLRIRLGLSQLINMPLLNILFIPIIFLSIAIFKLRNEVLIKIDVHEIIFPIFRDSIYIISFIIPILLLLSLIEVVGVITARKDEGDLQEAFDRQELQNGYPILMNKKKVKGSDVVMREFYSSISLKTWIDKMDDIADSMNVHFVEKIQYGGRTDGRRIVMYTAKGRKYAEREELYDEEF